MVDSNSLGWDKDSLRSLRLRLGWSKSDLARRLKCSIEQIDNWEEGSQSIDSATKGELEIICRLCEEMSDELRVSPMSEVLLEQKALDQINFSQLKLDLE